MTALKDDGPYRSPPSSPTPASSHRVFCRNCRHYRFPFDCTADGLRLRTDLIQGDYWKESIVRCDSRNTDLKCPLYKRKWWKFWVRR